MPSCGKQLQALKESNLKSGPAHLQTKPQGIPPTPLVPISISTGVDFVSREDTVEPPNKGHFGTMLSPVERLSSFNNELTATGKEPKSVSIVGRIVPFSDRGSSITVNMQNVSYRL